MFHEDDFRVFIVGFCILVVAFLVGVGIGYACGNGALRTEAVSASVAHYEADRTTGETRFVWDATAAPPVQQKPEREPR